MNEEQDEYRHTLEKIKQIREKRKEYGNLCKEILETVQMSSVNFPVVGKDNAVVHLNSVITDSNSSDFRYEWTCPTCDQPTPLGYCPDHPDEKPKRNHPNQNEIQKARFLMEFKVAGNSFRSTAMTAKQMETYSLNLIKQSFIFWAETYYEYGMPPLLGMKAGHTE